MNRSCYSRYVEKKEKEILDRKKTSPLRREEAEFALRISA
jgi:hypothetical protein